VGWRIEWDQGFDTVKEVSAIYEVSVDRFEVDQEKCEGIPEEKSTAVGHLFIFGRVDGDRFHLLLVSSPFAEEDALLVWWTILNLFMHSSNETAGICELIF